MSRAKKTRTPTRHRRKAQPDAFELQTQLDYLRGDITDVEALTHAAAQAANELPYAATPEQRRKVGRVYVLVHATFSAVSKLVG